VRILLADDHPLFRIALAQAVRAVAPEATIAEAGTFDDALVDLAAHADTDLVLLDLHMPGSHGLMALATLRGEYPAIAVAMISAHDDASTVRRALAHGAAGFISKRSGLDELQTALRAVLAAHLAAAIAARHRPRRRSGRGGTQARCAPRHTQPAADARARPRR
jgi:DNA-binding NarL/FixJ family response regulator